MTAKENISLHQLILYNISERILSGEWPPGYRIPFEHELMVEYNCSRMTVSKVLTHLANNHMIERRRKAGSFVFRPHSQSLVMEIADIKVEVAALGLPYSFDISSCAKRKSEQADCTSLDVRPLSAVLELVCCHYAGRQPFCLEERLINLAAVPEAADETFAEQSPGSWLMSRVPWTTAEHKIIATEPSAAVADALKLSAGKPCLVVERKTWSNNHTVTFVRLTYPGNLHELVARFAPVQSAKRMKIGKAVQDKSRTVSIGTSSAAPAIEVRPADCAVWHRAAEIMNERNSSPRGRSSTARSHARKYGAGMLRRRSIGMASRPFATSSTIIAIWPSTNPPPLVAASMPALDNFLNAQRHNVGTKLWLYINAFTYMTIHNRIAQ